MSSWEKGADAKGEKNGGVPPLCPTATELLRESQPLHSS